MPVHNYRVDPFTRADHSRYIANERHTVPSNSPFYVWLKELPRYEVPSTLTVALAAAIQQVPISTISGDDTFLEEANPATPHPSEPGLVVGTNGTGGQRNRSLVWFNVTTMPAGVKRAFLRVYLPAGNTGYADTELLGVHEVQASWDPATATWNNAPAYNPVASGSVIVVGPSWYDFDCTDTYNAWKAGTRTNHGLMLKHGDESGQNSALTFTSLEGTEAYRPVLYLVPQGAAFDEVDVSTVPSTTEVAVNYDRGVLRFHPSQAGLEVVIDYYGTGSPVNEGDVGDIDRYLGNGSDGDLVLLSGSVTLSGVKSYTSVYTAPGTTITVSGTHPLILGVTGDCRLLGTVDLDGKGFAGGLGGGPYGNGARGAGAAGGDGGFGSLFPSPWGTLFDGMLASTVVHAAIDYSVNEGAGDPPYAWIAYSTTVKTAWGLLDPIPGVYDPGVLLGNKLRQYGFPTMSDATRDAIAAWYNAATTPVLTDLVSFLAGSVRDNAVTGTGGGGGGGGSRAAGTSGSAGTGVGAGAGGRGGDESAFTDLFPTDFFPPLPGGGGGGGGGSTGVTGGNGGNGGGGLLLQVDGELYIDDNATITARGSAGASPNGGGGAGGSVWIRCSRRDVRCTPVVSGGAGAGTGGAGAAGWTLIEDL